MNWGTAFFVLCGLLQAVSAHGTGLMGYGQAWYDPPCAYACRAVFGMAPLDCPGMDMDHGGGHDMHGAAPMAPCIASNLDFLETLAWCLNERCPDTGVSPAQLEAYWANQATGNPAIVPEWTYGAVLAKMEKAPNRTYTAGDTLNYTAAISDEDYEYQCKFNVFFDWTEKIQSTYIIVIISIGVAVPVFLSAFSKLPFFPRAFDHLKPYLVYPATFGTHNLRPLPHLLGNVPTRGEGLYIAMFILLNIILGSISYRNFEFVHPWGFNKQNEILTYVGYRTGHISFALLPLTVLFSSRNNFLLWMTNWSHSTFIVLHRWVARVCAAHAIVHSITLLAAYESTGVYYTDVHKPYWIWGIIGTLCLVILLFQSMLWFRRKSYEVFLILHIVLAIFTVVGCWYHIYYWKPLTGTYEIWLYMVAAVWFFDRLARVARMVKSGICRAEVVELSPELVRVDIRGVRWSPEPGRHAYVYFPTLRRLRPWENHPFSIVHTSALQPQHPYVEGFEKSQNTSLHSDSPQLEEAKRPTTTIISKPKLTDGISIFVRKHSGLTSELQKASNLPVLLDGPYRNNTNSEVLKCDRVLLIGGGIGITGLISWVGQHTNIRLAWSIKESARPMLDDLTPALAAVEDKVVVVGERLDIEALLTHEAQSGWKRIGVVVCGPAGLCDDVRATVCRLGRRTPFVFELEVDAFDW